MNLEKYKWKSRILLVITPNFKDKSYQRVKKIYQSKIKEFHKRNVKLICKSNKYKNFSINLIGFDGKLKKRMNDLNPKLVFQIIDKMPLSKKIKPINLSLYSDYNPKTTTHGLGFKNKKKALFTINTIKNRSTKYQVNVVSTMLGRAKNHPNKTKDMVGAIKVFDDWLKKYKRKKMKSKMSNFLNKIIILTILIIPNIVNADFFEDITDKILDNPKRLSYGISVADINQNGKYEFIVTGFGYPNLALSYDDGILINVASQNIFSDETRKTIGVAACDVDRDGYEEIYFLNTDTYSGKKKYSDRLIDLEGNNFLDMFEIEKNKEDLNLTAGRSVACVDRKGNGEYGLYVSNYGGPTRFYEIQDKKIRDISVSLNLDKVTGGRAVVSGHILTDRSDIFAANERGPNFLLKNHNGVFEDVAFDYRVDDVIQNGRGTALSDILYRGRLDIISGNWQGYHRAYALKDNQFIDIGNSKFDKPSRIRTIISADFDNDGYDEVFMNNIAEPNKLFRIRENGAFEEIILEEGLEPDGFGTGAAVADIDDDGILELLVSRGESKEQPLTLYKAKVDKQSKYLRIKPLNKFGAPARGATVTLLTNQRKHSKTIDAGSGYLCQMEPVAHYGIRKNEKNFKVEVKWTDGTKNLIKITSLNQTVTVKQK